VMKSVVRQQAGLDQVVEIQSLQIECAHPLPDVPVQPETLLLIDLEMQESSVDLRILSQLVLNDLGASLQILRLAAREYGNAEGCPTRIEDCISNLGLNACVEAMSVPHASRDLCHHVIAETWEHSREIAVYSKLIAEKSQGVSPDEAYLVGLFHGIGWLPYLLGWDASETVPNHCSMMGLRLAREWSLPGFLVEYFREAQMASRQTMFPEIVRKAHWLASRPAIQCPYLDDLRPQLVHALRA
jgi:HD-like signal output (HDOD) protein